MDESIYTIDTNSMGLGATEINTNPNVTFNAENSEMLRIAKDGFYVRGKKVEIDDNEAETVYNAFHQWLTWSTLNRNY